MSQSLSPLEAANLLGFESRTAVRSLIRTGLPPPVKVKGWWLRGENDLIEVLRSRPALEH